MSLQPPKGQLSLPRSRITEPSPAQVIQCEQRGDPSRLPASCSSTTTSSHFREAGNREMIPRTLRHGARKAAGLSLDPRHSPLLFIVETARLLIVLSGRRFNGESRDLATAVQAPTHIWKGCTVMFTCTKKSYASPREALRALSILLRHGYPNLTGVHPCSLCHAWHTTSKKHPTRTLKQP